MFSPIFVVTNKLIKKLAQQYVSGIEIDSLPLWKGEVVVDNVNLNAEGLTEALAKANSPVRVVNVSSTRLSVKIPVFSPGVKPLLVKLHSFDLQLDIGVSEPAPPAPTEQPAAPEQDTPKTDEKKQSFITRLTSNILIHIDGVVLQLNIFGVMVQLVVSDFQVHIRPDSTEIRGKQVRGRMSNGKMALMLGVEELIIVIKLGGAETLITIHGLDAKLSDSNEGNTYYDLIPKPMSADIVIRPHSMSVNWESGVDLVMSLSSVPSVLELIAPFRKGAKLRIDHIHDFDALIGPMHIKFVISDAVSAILNIDNITVKDGVFNVGPISFCLKMVNKEYMIIEGFVLKGTWKQAKKVLTMNIESELLRLIAPAQKDLIDILKSLKMPSFDHVPKTVLPPPKPVFEQTCSTLRDLPGLNVSSRIIEFAFERPIVLTAFHFDESICRSKLKLQLRVWEPAFQSFIALVTFEAGDVLTDFSMTKEQMIPCQRFQLIFPQPLSSFPSFLEASVVHYQVSRFLRRNVFIKAHIKNIIVSVESYDLPIAILSVSNLRANAVLGPADAAKASLTFGVSALLSTFRSSTLVNILDIPSIAVQFSHFPDLSEHLIPLKWDESLLAQSLQSSYSANCTSVSARIPSVVVNAVPSVVFDLLRYVSTLSMENVVSHRIHNMSDVPFFYQVSNDADLIAVSTGESKNIVFRPGQIHFIVFPAQSARIVFSGPGFYKLSDSAYASVEMVSPFNFLVTIMASVQFSNQLNTDLEIAFTAESQTFHVVFDEKTQKATSSYILHKDFRLKLRLPDRTEWSPYIDLRCDNEVPRQMECDVLEMLPPTYLCAPTFHCWIVPKIKDIPLVGGETQQIIEFTFIPSLRIINKLNSHVVTSMGTIPPNSERLISQITKRELVFENQKVNVPFPLPEYAGKAVLDGMSVLVTTEPERNSVIFSMKFEVCNETVIPLFVQFQTSDPVKLEPKTARALPSGMDANWILIGIEGLRGDIAWSAPLQPPILKDITLRTHRGSVMLFAEISEDKAVIYPKFTAINDSSVPIWLKPATKIEPNSQVQLLEWRGKQSVSFGLSRAVEFCEPVSLHDHILWKRAFVKNEVGQTLNYVTYSIQANANPHELVFHNDPAPPLSIVNGLPSTYDIGYCGQTLVLQKNATILLPSVPDVIKIGRVGCPPFVVSLQYATELIMNENGAPVYVKIEKRANQARVTISNEKGTADPLKPRLAVSLFLSDFKVALFDDFTEPGTAKHVISVTLAPLSVDLLSIAGESTQVQAVLDVLQVDFLDHYERFPVMIQKSKQSRNLLQLAAKFTGTFDNGLTIDELNVNLQPLEIRVEESHLRFILQLVSLIAVKKQEEDEIQKEAEKIISTNIHPIYIRSLHISQTKLILSLATESFICADFSNIPIYLSQLSITNSESFDVALIQSISFHYVSDVIAAIPTILASFSLIGSPARIITQSIEGIRDFYRIAFNRNNSILVGLGRGSMSIVRGVTMGTLESVVGLAHSLEKSISKLKPFTSEGEEPELGTEMVQAVTGVVTLPVREFRQDGLSGMIKGAGRGLLGIVTVPTAACFTLLKRVGAAALHQVGGRQDNEVVDTRIDKDPRELPVLVLGDAE